MKDNYSIQQPSTSSSSFENDFDIGQFVGIRLDDNQKLKVLQNLWKPNASFPFPANEKKRRFQYQWFEKYSWLSYSEKLDGAFCKTCVAFSNGEGGQGNQRLGKLVLSPFRQWKDALETFASHQLNKYHKNCTVLAEEFKKVVEGKQENIGIKLNHIRNEEIEKNQQKLRSVIKTVIFCGRQGLALRGHRDFGNIQLVETGENDGNFRALLRFRAESGDENLKQGQEVINNKYTSPDTQNEIIKICGEIIQREIVEKINKAKCFAVLADESVDISGKEFLTLCARYVEECDSSVVIREDFLDFIEVENLSGAAIADTIISNVKKMGIHVRYLRGQGYDGASSMSGNLKGVQAQIMENYPTALYVHCCNHVLNLVLSKSCSVVSIRNSLATVQEIVTFFRASAKRRRILKLKLQSENETSNRTCLKKFCETRWVEQHEALFTFCENLNSVISSLLEIQEDSNTDLETSKKAMLFYNSLSQGSFLLSIFVAESCFAITHNLSIALQKEDADLLSSYNSLKEITEMFKKMRENSETRFSVIYKKVSGIAKNFDF